MQSPPDVIHYLSNDVFRAVRHATLHDVWKTKETGTSAPFKVFGGSSLHIPGSPTRIIHAEWAEGHSEPNPDLDIHRPHSILIERETYNSIQYEVSTEAWDDWQAAITGPIARRTLWHQKTRNGTTYWYANEHLGQAPQVGLKLTARLLEASLIWQATPAEYAQLLADRKALEASKPRTPVDVITEAMKSAA